MRELVLKRFISGEVAVGAFLGDLRGAVTRLDSIESTIEIEDMQESFPLSRHHLVMLCDAALSKTFSPDDLTTIAFALMASDRFEWDDEIVSEVLSDWACPEVNFDINASTLVMHRSWLTGDAIPPSRPAVSATPDLGRLVSVRRKVPAQ